MTSHYQAIVVLGRVLSSQATSHSRQSVVGWIPLNMASHHHRFGPSPSLKGVEHQIRVIVQGDW